MNPREKLEDADPATGRAFVQMFIRCADQLQFAIDSDVADDEEVRAYLNPCDSAHDNQSTFGVTAINEKTRFDTVKETLTKMGVEIVEEGADENEHESVGEYTAYYLKALAPDNIDADWNIPHLVVYGWLSPRLEEVCNATFGGKYDYADIRNHYVVYGDGVSADTKTELATAIQRSGRFRDEEQRDVVSDVNTADLV